MIEENQPEIIKKKIETIVLNEVSSKKITNWLEQISLKKKGIKISRKDFLNWLIEKTPDNLGSSDMNSLIDKFYDEENLLRQLLREVKKAKKDGQLEPSLEFIVRTKKTEQKKDIAADIEETMANTLAE